MEFWGVEVKSGEPFVVEQDEETILHLSQACLGEVKKDKGSEPVYLFAKVGDEKFVIGILSSEKFPQISFDLVFEKDFELSHNWKNGSVHFTGYKSYVPHGDDEDDDSSDSEDELAHVSFEHGGTSLQAKLEEKSEDVKKDIKPDQRVSTGNNEKVSSSNDVASDDEQATAKKEEESNEDDFETDEDESEDDESGESDESEEEENKVDISKKRPAEAAKKTSGGDKRAKFQTPEKAVAKTGGNKVGGHTATPHPAKQAGKTTAKNDQPKQHTPKSGGAFPCKSCNRSFGSDVALQSHTKAKHATVK